MPRPSLPAMTRSILAFGDSNTHGTPPAHAKGENRRFGPDVRWPGVMRAALGPDYAVIEEGLPGRTTNRADPLLGPHMDGQLGLRIALESHGPIDLLIIMLGTNDCQTQHATTAAEVIAGLAALLAIARSEPYQTRHGGFEILLIAPPPILEQGVYKDTLWGAAARSAALPGLMQSLADHWGVGFLDAGAHIAVSPIDGVHFDEAAHATLGAAVAEKVRRL